MIRPDDEERSFKARWEALCRILLVEPSVKLIALMAAQHAGFQDGTNCHPSNDRLCRMTGYSRRTIISAWATLRELGMAERTDTAVSYQRKADTYDLRIPDDWAGLPILGPREDPFMCQYCAKQFNPPPVTFLDKNGKACFRVYDACFCPTSHEAATGRCRKPGTCCQCLWLKGQRAAGAVQSPAEMWKLFRQARGDDW